MKRIIGIRKNESNNMVYIDFNWMGGNGNHSCLALEYYPNFTERSYQPDNRFGIDPNDYVWQPDLALNKALCHCNYDKNSPPCSGVFNAVKNNEIVCNECGMGILELVALLVENKQSIRVKDFKKKTKPVIKWLNDNCPNPHVSIIITPTNAELVEGIMSTGKVLDYLKD